MKTQSVRQPLCRIYPDKVGGGTHKDAKHLNKRRRCLYNIIFKEVANHFHFDFLSISASQIIVNGHPYISQMYYFEDPLLRDVVDLAMSALVSAGDLLSLTTLELMAYIHGIPHNFSAAWQKSMTSSIVDFIFACARGYT